MREVRVERETAETRVRVALNLDGQGRAAIATGVGFFDHMLTLLAYQALFDLAVEAEGDLHVDAHHTVEDVGIVLGQALARALGDRRGIRRYGQALTPMDEALALVALDCSGRGLLVWEGGFPTEKVGTFDTELVPEFFRALALHGGLTLHIRLLAGANSHHMAEAAFKGVGRALRQAVAPDPRRGEVPSTKGVL